MDKVIVVMGKRVIHKASRKTKFALDFNTCSGAFRCELFPKVAQRWKDVTCKSCLKKKPKWIK